MPVSSQKKRTTSTPNPSTPESSSPVLPQQQEFHQHLRALAQSAVRIVIETVMREELDQFIGAGWLYEPALRRTKMDGLGGSHDLRSRGATPIDLIVTDGHDGLLAAVSQLFSATPPQRCLVHKQRNVLNATHKFEPCAPCSMMKRSAI